MPKAKNPNALGFTSSDRRRLARAVRQVTDKRTFQRLRALYLIATGYPISDVARIIGVSRQSLYNWINNYLATHQAESLFDAPRTGRPPSAQKITSARIVRQFRRDPLPLGYNTTTWTVALLARHLSERYHTSITPRTLRRRMKELGLRWKRPRHAFSTKEPHLAQKKGLLSVV